MYISIRGNNKPYDNHGTLHGSNIVFLVELKQILDSFRYSLGYIAMYSNAKRVFGYTVNDFSALIIAYLTSLMVFQ